MRNSPFPGLAMVIMVMVCSCKSNYICPSYESAYILDQSTRHKKFSLFDEDTLPKADMDANKNRYLVIEDIKYKKKRDQMRTVKMETIFPQVEPPDTLLLAEQDLSPEDMERLINEGDRPVNQFNVDQIYYMRHFGQYLPMPEEPAIGEQEQADQEEFEEELLEESQFKKKKKWQFWKKDGQEVDSLNIGFEEELDEPEERELTKKEQRRQEQLEQQEQEEMERARQPQVIDLEDFEEDRGVSTQPEEEKPARKRKVKDKSTKEKKKIKLGFGKKNKVEDVELEE